MRTIYVSPEFPLNRRMRKDVRRGKLQVVREGGERSSLGGGIPSGKRRGLRTTGSRLVCMVDNGAEVSGGLGEGQHNDRVDTLTEEQTKVIQHDDRAAVRLVAGPGTGKTFTLTEYVAHLIIEEGVSPKEIQLISFTRMTAHDLQESIVDRLGKKSPRASTLHSYALQKLLASGEAVHELPQPLCIADDWEEENIIRKDLQFLCGIGLKAVDDNVKKMASDWATLRADESGWEKDFPNPSFMGVWNSHRWAYGYTLRAELVYRLKELFSRRGDFASNMLVPRYLLVDEYQDLNHCDVDVIHKFASLGARLLVAGDDDQSIYGFRNAHPAGIRNFMQDYHEKGPISLSLNLCQRCPREILDLSEYVIGQQGDEGKRIPKDISTEKNGGKVDILCFPNQESEARGIAQICRALINDGVAPDCILILLRGDPQHRFSKPLIENLKCLGIEAGGRKVSNPLDENNGRMLLSFMRLAVCQKDSLAWRAILNLWCRGIGDKTIDIYYQRTNRLKNFGQVLLDLYTNGRGAFSKGREKTFFNHVDKILKKIEMLFPKVALESKETPEDVMAVVREAAVDLIKDENKRNEVLEKFQQISHATGAVSIGDLVQEARKEYTASEKSESDDEDSEVESNKINILTMHKAKGLTAEVVIVVGAEDENISEKNPVEEECRLFYVSLTRAKKRLFITHCDRREGIQKHSGRNVGSSHRRIIRFLDGCPYKSQDGEEFARKFNG